MPKPEVLHALVVASALIGASCGTGDIVVSVNPTPTAPVAAPEPAPTDDPAPQPTTPPAPAPTPTPAPTPEPTPVPGELIVTDTDMAGTPGDGVLSLVEAVELANGRLALADLDDGERSFVRGEPGPENPDQINVDLDLGVRERLQAPGGNAWIVELFGNDGDTLDGGGVTVVPSADDGESRNVVLIGSSDVTISGFTFIQVTNPIAVESAGNDLGGIEITQNAFVDSGGDAVSVRNSLAASSISDISIVANAFAAQERRADVRRFVVLAAGVALADQTNEASSIRDVRIRDNTMTSGTGAVARCISVHAGVVQADMPGETTGATVAGVDISGNTLTGCALAVEIVAGLAAPTGGRVSASTITDVAVTGNDIESAELGTAIIAGMVFPDDGGPVEVTGNRISEVALRATTYAEVDLALTLVGGSSSGPGASVTQNAVSAITADEAEPEGAGVGCFEVADAGLGASANRLDTGCDELAGGADPGG